MITKRLICHHRKRRIPTRFSWIDHRFVRDGHCRECSAEAAGLYLFLITVSDCEGLSYYSERSISCEINCSIEKVQQLRRELISAGLIAYCNKIYQVLELEDKDEIKKTEDYEVLKGTHSMNDILMNMFGGKSND